MSIFVIKKPCHCEATLTSVPRKLSAQKKAQDKGETGRCTLNGLIEDGIVGETSWHLRMEIANQYGRTDFKQLRLDRIA